MSSSEAQKFGLVNEAYGSSRSSEHKEPGAEEVINHGDYLGSTQLRFYRTDVR
jgi:hypothetical protein